MENDNASSCKLKIPKNLNEKTPVFLTRFSNGCVNLNTSQALTFNCYRHVSKEGKIERVLCAENGRLTYKSEMLDRRNNGVDNIQYFVGVRNKATGRMKVYESVSFLLKPEMDRKTPLPSTSEDRDIRKKLDDLTLSFGSKGKKRSMAARLRYSDTTTTSEIFDDIDIDDFATNKVNVDRKSSTSIQYIPPQNRDATCASEVYEIGDIISPEADEFLSKRAEQLLKDLPTHLPQWEADNTYCEYMLQHMKNEPSQEKTKYLLYFHYLWRFSQYLSPEFRKKDPATEIPEPIRSNLLDCFTVTSAEDNKRPMRSFPLMMKDKLLAFAIVLALFIDDYKVNLASLQKSSKYGLSKIEKVAQTLGCHVNSRKVENLNIKFAELRVPLFTPKTYFNK